MVVVWKQQCKIHAGLNSPDADRASCSYPQDTHAWHLL
jgi:hypothetical protein